MGQLDYDALRFWLELLLALAALSATGYGWWIGRTRATRANIEAVNTRVTVVYDDCRQSINVLRKDLDKVEVKMEGLPNHDDLAEMHKKINGVDSQLQQIIGGLTEVKSTVGMINQHLLTRDSK